jgi:hypothetical protein
MSLGKRGLLIAAVGIVVGCIVGAMFAFIVIRPQNTPAKYIPQTYQWTYRELLNDVSNNDTMAGSLGMHSYKTLREGDHLIINDYIEYEMYLNDSPDLGSPTNLWMMSTHSVTWYHIGNLSWANPTSDPATWLLIQGNITGQFHNGDHVNIVVTVGASANYLGETWQPFEEYICVASPLYMIPASCMVHV